MSRSAVSPTLAPAGEPPMLPCRRPVPPTEHSAWVALSDIAQAVASVGNTDIFEVLVCGAARALAVDVVLVGILEDGVPERVRTIAVCDRSEIQPNFQYLLAGTPCEHVVGQRFRYHARGIQELFPEPRLRAIDAVGYAAIPLYDSRGRSIGLMALIDRKPLPNETLTECVLKIFSVRAAVELERRTVDEARRCSEESYRSMFEAAEDGLFVHDANSGAILDVNPKACEVCGYTRDELLATDVGRLSSGVPPYTLDHAVALMERARRAGPVYTEWHRRNKDGSLHWVEIYVKLVKIGGADRILAVTREITERKAREAEHLRLESQLRQAQKMEAIGQLTGGIAHDFNNILTGTLGYLGMAREQAERYGDPTLVKYLERAEHSGQRASALIAEMLTFSRGQRGTPRPLRLAPHLTETLNLLKASLPSSVEIQTDFAPVLPCVHLDPLHVDQVLMNLCINARDAMQGQGRLTLSLQTARCPGAVCTSCHQPVGGTFVELAVADTGPGISETVLERMFEPFFSTKPTGKGSGMGLAMVHGIVHEYGGHIQVATASGAGTTVRVWLPAWFPAPGAAQGEVQAPVTTTKAHDTRRELCGHVLVAEDEAPVREFMEDLLGSWGLAVTLAEDGRQAWERYSANPGSFDLIVLDQTMPRMTGLETAERLLRARPGLPVILYTGYSEHLAEGRVSAAGVRAVMRKPLDVPAFRELVEALLPPRDAR